LRQSGQFQGIPAVNLFTDEEKMSKRLLSHGLAVAALSCVLAFPPSSPAAAAVANPPISTSGRVALLVVDMLNDFIDPRGVLYVGPQSRAIIPFINQKAAEVRSQGGVVIFTCDAHSPDDPEFQQYPPHAIKGTWGAQLIPELALQPGDYLVEKTTFNAFTNTTLEDLLQQENVGAVQVVGVLTSICVLETVRGLYERGIPRLVYQAGVADLDPDSQNYGLDYMQQFLGATIVRNGAALPAINLLLLTAVLPAKPGLMMGVR
jgi:nicotinamidase/pyrazinamidase